MFTLILSYVAGVLTVTAPCIFTLLPIIVGGSMTSEKERRLRITRPLVITLSLAGSIVVFTLLLKYSTSLLGVPDIFWKLMSGSIVIILGLQFIWPALWLKAASLLKLEQYANKSLGKVVFKSGRTGDILTGLALGPVFSSCSPTYAFIVASVLTVSFVEGTIYLIAYALGLASALMFISLSGQAVAQKLGWLANPNGKFRKIMGILFVLVGLAIIFGLDKKLEASILDSGMTDGIIDFENRLRQ